MDRPPRPPHAPCPCPHPHRFYTRPAVPSDRQRYMAQLLAERDILSRFWQRLPLCSRFLQQEIMRTTGLAPNQVFPYSGIIEQTPPLVSVVSPSTRSPMDMKSLPGNRAEESGYFHRMGVLPCWNAAPKSSAVPNCTKFVSVHVPVDKYPNYNFVDRLLGPGGDFLKSLGASTQCKFHLLGKGSITDPTLEEKLRAEHGDEFLNQPLYVLIEAEFPLDVVDAHLRQAETIIKDFLKLMEDEAQRRELAIQNGTLRE